MITEIDSNSEATRALEKKLLAWFGLLLAISIVMVAAAIRNTFQSAESSDWVNHTHAVILENDAILSTLHAAEAAQRTFLLTGTAQSQAAYRDYFAQMTEHIDVAKTLSRGNTAHSNRLSRIEQLIAEQVEISRSSTLARQETGIDAATQVLTNSNPFDRLTAIRQEIGSLKAEANRMLQERETNLNRATRKTHWILYGGLGLNFLLLIFIFALIRIDLRVRQKAASALQQLNESLEIKVRERTADLANANRALELENLEQKWTQGSLRRLHSHYELIFNSIENPIFVVSRLGNIINLNSSAAHLLNSEHTKAIGKRITEIILSNSNATPHPLFQAAREGKKVPETAGFLRVPDGSQRPISFSADPVHDNERTVAAVVTVSLK